MSSNELALNAFNSIDFSLDCESVYDQIMSEKLKLKKVSLIKFYKHLLTVEGFFLSSDFKPIVNFFEKTRKLYGKEDKGNIEEFMSNNGYALLKCEWGSSYYYLFHINGKVKAQVWSKDIGCTYDIIRNKLDDVLDELGCTGVHLVKQQDHDAIENLLLKSQPSYSPM